MSYFPIAQLTNAICANRSIYTAGPVTAPATPQYAAATGTPLPKIVSSTGA